MAKIVQSRMDSKGWFGLGLSFKSGAGIHRALPVAAFMFILGRVRDRLGSGALCLFPGCTKGTKGGRAWT